MTDKEKILAEIESELSLIAKDNLYDEGRWNELNHLKLFINSLPEEPVSEDLKEAADKYATEVYNKYLNDENTIKDKDGLEILTEAFTAGAQWQKKQMMKDAVSGKVTSRFPLASDPFYSDVEVYLNFTNRLSEGDKVKVIIIKDK